MSSLGSQLYFFVGFPWDEIEGRVKASSHRNYNISIETRFCIIVPLLRLLEIRILYYN